MPVDSDSRPDPDALLRRVSSEERRTARAKLKIYFGFAPGVGKTFAMLQLASRLKAQGVEVVVGVVETHGRRETAALLEGLEVIPKKRVEYRGMIIEEFDLDRTLKRRPPVVLLDELAHTNAPGCRHDKRWQDVLELLDAGIDVVTTLNVQHVESLNDVVAQITGVQVRETVPDAVLERADSLDCIDLSPEELLQRLKEGKVYLGEQAGRAAQNFFQRGNLLALREVALRRAADRVDVDVQAYREENAITAAWPAAERIVVCVDTHAGAARLIRAARRMATGLRGSWVALNVEVAGQAPLADDARERLESHLHLAESLGATVVRLTSHSIGHAILEFARQSNATRIIVGKSRMGGVRHYFSRSLLDEIVRGSGDVDVHVITGDAEDEPSDRGERVRGVSRPESLLAYVWSLGIILATTGIAAGLFALLDIPDVEMLYLVGIMVVATRFGRGPSAAAAAFSVLAYNFVFVEPRFTFAVSDSRYGLTFGLMFGMGLLISTLTLRLRRQESAAVQREDRANTLYTLSRDLGSALDKEHISAIAVRHAADLFDAPSGVFLVGPDGQFAPSRVAPEGAVFESADIAVAKWVFEHSRRAGLGTDTLPGARVVCTPLESMNKTSGVLALLPRDATPLRADQRIFLDAFGRQVALALERAELVEEARAAALKARTEELRSSLLSSVSHDLRTPLAVITGTVTMLRGDQTVSESLRKELLDTVWEEAERLERLVANLLDMTRLASGDLRVKRELVPVEELLGPAVTRLERHLQGRVVSVEVPADLPLVSVDPVLFQQLLLNLIENACKYTPAGTPIDISARAMEAAIEIDVADRGPGLNPGDQSRLFDKFVRGDHAGVGGVGLGLAICRAIAEAHGGHISAHDRPGGGALFRVALPREVVHA